MRGRRVVAHFGLYVLAIIDSLGVKSDPNCMFGSGASAQFAQMVSQKTGLQPQGDRFVGTFQGLPAWAQAQMVGDAMGSFVRGDGGMLGGLGMLVGGSAGGMAHAMTGGAFFMKHDYHVELPGTNLTGASIRETSSLGHDKSWQRQGSIGQRQSSGVAWIDQKFEVCANDPRLIQWICGSHEFQQCLNNWHMVNIAWMGSGIHVEVLDSSARIASAWGTPALQNGDMILGGLWLAASGARATYAR